jgi:hypothetical protein
MIPKAILLARQTALAMIHRLVDDVHVTYRQTRSQFSHQLTSSRRERREDVLSSPTTMTSRPALINPLTLASSVLRKFILYGSRSSFVSFGQ